MKLTRKDVLAMFNYSDKEITLPNDITVIGKDAFKGFRYLEKIILPESTAIIDNNAFKDCVRLKEINLDNVHVVYKDAFNNCISLDKEKYKDVIDLKDTYQNSSFEKTNDVPTTLTQEYAEKMFNKNATTIEIPEGIYKIDDKAFENFKALKEVNLPSTVAIIGREAFRNIPSLTKINLENVSYIEELAFSSCSLKETNFKEGVYISHLAFSCNQITHLEIPKHSYIGANAFDYAPLKTLKINEGVNIDRYNDFRGDGEIFVSTYNSDIWIDGDKVNLIINNSVIPFKQNISIKADKLIINSEIVAGNIIGDEIYFSDKVKFIGKQLDITEDTKIFVAMDENDFKNTEFFKDKEAKNIKLNVEYINQDEVEKIINYIESPKEADVEEKDKDKTSSHSDVYRFIRFTDNVEDDD